MKPLELTPHPAGDAPDLHVEVDVRRAQGSTLALRFGVTGSLASVRWPTPVRAARADELWRHTCFEAFVRAAGDEAYCEVNASPSSEWAVYRFRSWRDGMTPAEACPAPSLRFVLDEASAEMDVRLSLAWSDRLATADWRVGIAAVVKNMEGTRSFWALAHPPSEPDFHDPETFVVTLPR